MSKLTTKYENNRRIGKTTIDLEIETKRNRLLFERFPKMLVRIGVRNLQIVSFVSHHEEVLKQRFHDRRGGFVCSRRVLVLFLLFLDQKQYRGMIGSLLYLTASRPDILFCVCLCARFLSNPKESHLTAVK